MIVRSIPQIYFNIRVIMLLLCFLLWTIAGKYKCNVNDEYTFGNITQDEYLSKLRKANKFIFILDFLIVFDILVLMKFIDVIIMIIEEIKHIWSILMK